MTLARGKSVTRETGAQDARLETAIASVAAEYRISVAELLSRSQFARIVRPRQIAMWLVRNSTDCSLSEIGRAFNRERKTVFYSINRVKTLRRLHSGLKMTTNRLLAELLGDEVARAIIKKEDP